MCPAPGPALSAHGRGTSHVPARENLWLGIQHRGMSVLPDLCAVPRGDQPEIWPLPGVVRSQPRTGASPASPVSGTLLVQPPRCDIVAVLTGTMSHRSG